MKIGSVRAGQVGRHSALHSTMMRRVAIRITLVDRNTDLVIAQARDSWTLRLLRILCVRGDSAGLDGARVVVLAAGTNERPGESRLDLLSRNAKIFAEIVPAVLAARRAQAFWWRPDPDCHCDRRPGRGGVRTGDRVWCHRHGAVPHATRCASRYLIETQLCLRRP